VSPAPEGVPPLAISIVNLPDGVVGTWYSAKLSDNGGGLLPLTWSLVAGSLPLPAGLQLTPSGRVFGMPVAAATVQLFVAVQDSALGHDSQIVGLHIGAAPAADPSNPFPQSRQASYWLG
jgi:hypothetical protein